MSDERPEVGKKRRRDLRIAAIALAVSTLIVVIFYAIGSSTYSYSSDQREALEEFGSPDSFLITFSQSEHGSFERVEEWHYHRHGILLNFLEGQAMLMEAMESPENIVTPTPYEPGQFSPFAKWKDIFYDIGEKPAARGSDYYAELFEDEGVELYYSEQLVVGVEEESERLIYVEAKALAEER